MQELEFFDTFGGRSHGATRVSIKKGDNPNLVIGTDLMQTRGWWWQYDLWSTRLYKACKSHMLVLDALWDPAVDETCVALFCGCLQWMWVWFDSCFSGSWWQPPGEDVLGASTANLGDRKIHWQNEKNQQEVFIRMKWRRYKWTGVMETWSWNKTQQRCAKGEVIQDQEKWQSDWNGSLFVESATRMYTPDLVLLGFLSARMVLYNHIMPPMWSTDASSVGLTASCNSGLSVEAEVFDATSKGKRIHTGDLPEFVHISSAYFLAIFTLGNSDLKMVCGNECNCSWHGHKGIVEHVGGWAIPGCF